MYGPIANLPGYNPNATYLPPGVAAPSSYPEWSPPKQQFYDMPALPPSAMPACRIWPATDDPLIEHVATTRSYDRFPAVHWTALPIAMRSRADFAALPPGA